MEAEISQHTLSTVIHDQNIREQKKMSDSQEIAISFVGGCIAGISYVLSGHPFDTIKVRMQMSEIGFFSCLRNMVQQEGLKSLYKGVASPLTSVPFIQSINFGSYELGKYLQGCDLHGQMSFSQSVKAGAFSGLAGCIVLTPVELVKCKLQMDGVGSRQSSISSWKLAKNIYSSEGLRGLYKGNVITVFREAAAGAAFFSSYEYFKHLFDARFGPSYVTPFLTGGIAGLMSSLFSYPQDVIKTKLQCDGMSGHRIYPGHPFLRDGGILACIKDIYRTDGFAGFWRGFTAGTMRYIVTEAVTIVVYVEGKKALKSFSD